MTVSVAVEAAAAAVAASAWRSCMKVPAASLTRCDGVSERDLDWKRLDGSEVPYIFHASTRLTVLRSASSLPHVKRHLDSCCRNHTVSEGWESQGGVR